MNRESIINCLSAYLKYRQGKGKKYAEPDVPFGNEAVTQAIRDALKIVRASVKFTERIG